MLIMTITWSLSTIVGDNGTDDSKKCREIAGDFNHHGDAAIQCGAHCPMKHILGFTRSHLMLPSVKCLCRIAPAAVKVINFE
jgi:hypothetical protein